MKESVKTSIESLFDGLKIDGKVEASEVITVVKKIAELAVVSKDAIKLDGKVEVSEVAGVLKAIAATAPKEFWAAMFAVAHEEIKESKTKIDDLLEPALTLLERIIVKK